MMNMHDEGALDRRAAQLAELMRSRRSIRRFRPELPERGLVERLIEAAITAPSASNAQPWRFLAIGKRELIDELAAAVEEAVDRIAQHVEPASEQAFRAYGDYFTRFVDAPLLIVCLYRNFSFLSHLVDKDLPPSDCEQIAQLEGNSGPIGASLALENLLLMAHALGLGASGMTGPLVASERIRQILDLASPWDVLAFVPVGYPAEDPEPPDRRPLARVLRWIS